MVKNETLSAIKDVVKKQAVETIIEFSEDIKARIVNSFDLALGGVVITPGSKINIQNIRSSLIDQLNEFNYVTVGNSISMHVPDMETFNFSKNPDLRLLQAITEGVIGTFVLVNGKEFVSIYGHKPINEETLEESFAPGDMLYLVPYSPKVQSAEAKLKTKFTKYPFSNMPPLRLFEEAENFANKNLEDKLRVDIEKRIKEKYKGS